MPGGDVGLAVIILTIAIRFLLLPFSLSAARTQRAMKVLQPKIDALKEKHKGDKEKEALETLALYREARVNPFASILTVFVQIPVLLALYFVFRYEPFTSLDVARLYTFTPIPHTISLYFLGTVYVAGKSIVLAVCAGFTQYLQAHLTLSGSAQSTSASAQGDFQQVMSVQLKYIFPVIITVIAYSTSSAVSIYWITNNLIGAIQEWHVRRTIRAEF